MIVTFGFGDFVRLSKVDLMASGAYIDQLSRNPSTSGVQAYRNL